MRRAAIAVVLIVTVAAAQSGCSWSLTPPPVNPTTGEAIEGGSEWCDASVAMPIMDIVGADFLAGVGLVSLWMAAASNAVCDSSGGSSCGGTSGTAVGLGIGFLVLAGVEVAAAIHGFRTSSMCRRYRKGMTRQYSLLDSTPRLAPPGLVSLPMPAQSE